jgi:hypothetical protein
MNCAQNRLAPPRVVALARDSYLAPTTPLADSIHLPASFTPRYGQDISSGYGRAAPDGQSVGTTPAELKPKMQKLLSIFAAGDRTGMAGRLLSAFLQKRSKVSYFDDGSLNSAAAGHKNIEHFCDVALSGPPTPPPPGKKRIHQALKDAGWDIKKLIAPSDLTWPSSAPIRTG